VNSELRYESSGGIATITIARPAKKNAINKNVARGLAEAWDRLESGPDRVAVITGEGDGAFTSGVDVTDPPEGYGFLPGLGGTITKPVIAAVSGWCVGAGMVMVNRADICVADEDAEFMYPEPKLAVGRGLLAGIVHRVPYKAAMEILLLAEAMPAERMSELGLVNRITPHGNAVKVAMDLAANLASYDLDTLRFIKECVLKTLPEGPGEFAEAMRARGDKLPGNQTWGKKDA